MAAEGTKARIVKKGGHVLVKQANLAVAKVSTSVLNGGEIITHQFGGLFSALNALTPGLNVGALLGMGVVVATGAALAQLDYRNEISDLIDTYRDQLSAALKKPVHALTEKDLTVFAKGDAKRGIAANPVIAQELRKKRAERTLGVGLSVGATLVSYAILASALGATTALAGSIGVPLIVVECAIGLGLYNVIKEPLKIIGHKMFGLGHKTTHDHIEKLALVRSDGKTVTREQVLQVFASADPKLDAYIESTYGATFEKLSREEQQRAAQDPKLMEMLSRVSIDINEGRMSAGELAFMAEGQLSEIKAKTRAPVEYDNPTPKKSFVERYHERQAEPPQISPTIH
jgi:hypothetical protein